MLTKIPSDAFTHAGPYRSYHYKDASKDKTNSDSYMNATSACAFLKVLEEHNNLCSSPGCQVQFGDAYSAASWGEHKGHKDGTCIDIRPQRKSSDTTAITRRSTDYDYQKTVQLIAELRMAGASNIFFNDPNIGNLLPFVRRLNNHVNHIHACFDPNNGKVKDTCSNPKSVLATTIENEKKGRWSYREFVSRIQSQSAILFGESSGDE
jgi:hypothetical protein